MLSKGYSLRFRAKGRSMHPFIRDGEVISVKPIKGSNIMIGDIIFYRALWGGIFAHRVIKKHRENNNMILITKGDANLNFDPPVHEDNIIGKVTAIEKNNVTIKLDSKILQLTNYIIATSSLLGGYLKEDVDGERNFSLYILSFFPKFLLKTLFVGYKIKSKLKLNTG
jgi:signal peptidase I